MIELNKTYSMQELANLLGVSYGTFRNNRQLYEEHLNKFYSVAINKQGKSISYIFFESLSPYIPYKEYKKQKKQELIQKCIKQVIKEDNRQTGSNIARIIFVDDAIQALGWAESTLTIYVREELRQLVQDGYYLKTDFRWCYLNKTKNCYELMTDEEVQELRTLFNTKEVLEQEENIWSNQEQGDISYQDATNAIGKLRKEAFMNGREKYFVKYGYWPIKVPVYEVNAFWL